MASPSYTPAPPPPLPDQDHDQNPDPQEPSSPSPTPTPTPSNPNSPKSIQLTPPPRKPQPLPWSRDETVNLIQAYQEKWYSLKRGQLKASQWEEVAITVAARCGYDAPSKTAIQCRHKIEKLRKRYRAEKQKSNPHAWEYFELMDHMERGPLPITARPMAIAPYHNSDPGVGGEEEVNEAKFQNTSKRNRSKRINHVVHGHVTANKPAADRNLSGRSDRVSGFMQKPSFHKRKERFARYESDEEDEDEEDEGQNEEEEEEEMEEEEEEEEQEEVGGGGREMVVKLAAEIKAFAERFVKMESKKMEMMRETERYRMEMENKRMEMILESHRKIVDTIRRAFGSHKKVKTAQEI